MINTVYNSNTGQILYTIFGSLPFDGESYISGAYNDRAHYVDLNSNTVITKPAKPSDNHVWDINNKVWVEDTNKTINSARAQRNQLLTAIDRVNPVWYAGLTVDQQTELQTYRTALLNVPQQSGFPATIEWPSKPSWL